MADDKNITQVNAAGAVQATDLIPVAQGDARLKRATAQEVADFAVANGTFLQSGTGAVSRTTQAKLRDRISVFDFMSPDLQAKISLRTSGSSDAAATTAAINAALTANPNAALYFPPGWYDVNETFTIQTAGRILYGDGQAVVLIRQRTADIDTFVFGPPTSGSFLSGCGFYGISVSHGNVVASSTQGAGVRFVQCSNYEFHQSAVNDAVEGLVIEGGQFGSLKSFRLFASAGTAIAGNSALLHFKDADLGGGSYQPCYTIEIEDFRISTNELRSSCIRFASADGLQFTNGYLALGAEDLVRVAFERDGASVAVVTFTNTYFDCVNVTTGTPLAVNIPDDAFTNSYVFGITFGSGCTIGNSPGRGVLSRKPEVLRLSFEGVKFTNLTEWAIDAEGGSTGLGTLLDLHVNGCHFQNVGSASTGAIRAATEGRSISITGNVFTSVENLCVSLAGSWTAGVITGNVNTGTISDIANTATFTGTFQMGNNASRYTTGAANSWFGVVGTVSQTNGVPTGRIIERGNNSNGSYVRYADGTQFCWHETTVNLAIANAFMGGFRTGGQTWTFPIAFANSTATVWVNPDNVTAFGASAARSSGSPNTAATWVVTAVTSQGAADRTVFLFAIGRWF